MNRIVLDPESLVVETRETAAAEPFGAVPTTTWLSRVTACTLC